MSYDKAAVSDLQIFIRQIVRGAYDIQALRIAMGNRVAAAFKTKLGVQSGTKKEDADTEVKNILRTIAEVYDTITYGYTSFPTPKQFDSKGSSVISSWTELVMVAEWKKLMEEEEIHFKRLAKIVEDHPMWPFFKATRGLGPAMAGVLISEIDISKADYPSSLHMLAGLDVAPDGRGRSKRKEHLVEREYMDREGKTKTRMGITFNPFLKTKLMGVLGPSFLKQGGPYREIYDNYKHRLETSPEFQKKQERLAKEAKEKKQRYAPTGHRHQMAVRYAVKMFLIDLYKAWREVAGLPVADPYHVAKLGLRDHSALAAEQT